SVASLREMAADERLQFAPAFGDLLFGEGPSPERLERFVRSAWPIMHRTLRGNPYAHSRIFPTVFLMAHDPANDIAVRTNLFGRATRSLRGRRLLENAPFDARQYREILAFARAIFRQLELWAWRPRDLIDVQTFLWVAISPDYATPPSNAEETED